MMNKQYIACIIDDDTINQFVFTRIIQNHHFTKEIITFPNGQEALSFLTNNLDCQKIPDVIFVDINMPVMDGWEFLEHYTQLKISKKVLIYLLSSSVNPADIEKSKRIPLVNSYFVKPIKTEQIQEIILALQKE